MAPEVGLVPQVVYTQGSYACFARLFKLTLSLLFTAAACGLLTLSLTVHGQGTWQESRGGARTKGPISQTHPMAQSANHCSTRSSVGSETGRFRDAFSSPISQRPASVRIKESVDLSEFQEEVFECELVHSGDCLSSPAGFAGDAHVLIHEATFLRTEDVDSEKGDPQFQSPAEESDLALQGIVVPPRRVSSSWNETHNDGPSLTLLSQRVSSHQGSFDKPPGVD